MAANWLDFGQRFRLSRRALRLGKTVWTPPSRDRLLAAALRPAQPAGPHLQAVSRAERHAGPARRRPLRRPAAATGHCPRTGDSAATAHSRRADRGHPALYHQGHSQGHQIAGRKRRDGDPAGRAVFRFRPRSRRRLRGDGPRRGRVRRLHGLDDRGRGPPLHHDPRRATPRPCAPRPWAPSARPGASAPRTRLDVWAAGCSARRPARRRACRRPRPACPG
jgi:hypothetical protein